jgi:hypothetical protein
MSKKGLIKTIIVIVIALVILGYFGFNVGDIINSPTVQANLHSTWDFIVKVWNNYLSAPVVYVWDHFIVGLIWPLIKSILPAATSTPPVL